MRHHTPEFEAPAMHEIQLLIHLREQVSRKTRHILGNLVEAEHDPSKIRSSLLRVYEKKLGTYYQEYVKLHQEILDRIPASEFEDQGDLEMEFYRLHTEALLRIEQLSASLAGKYELSKNERLGLESFQSRQWPEPAQKEQSDKSHVVPSHHVATNVNNVESAQGERSNRSSVTPANHTVTPTQPPSKSQPRECQGIGSLHNRHQVKSVSEELYDSSSLEPPAISETSKDEPREHDRSSSTKEPRNTTRCGLPSTEDRQGADWKRTSLRAEFIPSKLSSQSCVQLSSGTAIPVQVIQPASKDWRSSGRVRIRHQPQCGSEELSDASRVEPSIQGSDHQSKNAQKEHSQTSDESAAPGLLHEVDHQLRLECDKEEHSRQPSVGPHPNVHSTTSIEHPESAQKEHSKLTSFKQLRRVETSTETMTVAAVKYPELAQEKLSGPSSVEQPVRTATFIEGSAFTPRMQTKSSVMEMTKPSSRTTESMASKKESESAQEELSDWSCVHQLAHTATSAVEPESAHKEHSKPCIDDLPDATAETPNHVKTAQDEQFWLSYVKTLRGTIAADRKIILHKPIMLLGGKPSFATVINQVESAQGEPSKPSTCVKPLVNPAVFSKGSELETMECGIVTAVSVKLALDTAVRVTVFDSNSEKGRFHDLQRLKATKKWHTKPAKPPPMISRNDSSSRSEMIVEQFSPDKAGQAGLSNMKEMYYVVLPTKIVQPREEETEYALFGQQSVRKAVEGQLKIRFSCLYHTREENSKSPMETVHRQRILDLNGKGKIQPSRRGWMFGKIPTSRLPLQMDCREDNRHPMPLLRQECFQPGGSMFAPIGHSGGKCAPHSPTSLNSVTQAPTNVNTATARDHSPLTMMTLRASARQRGAHAATGKYTADSQKAGSSSRRFLVAAAPILCIWCGRHCTMSSGKSDSVLNPLLTTSHNGGTIFFTGSHTAQPTSTVIFVKHRPRQTKVIVSDAISAS
ncbi:uncharacterized protein LOC134290238 [Aedes albopictus]|uniref:Uncharacterized protein n=1 Tax=Aedes albopictus TaxID=7160 RepID=A0ABM1Z389_AEDAL